MRVPVGGYLKGGAVYHCNPARHSSRIPGIDDRLSVNGADANGLLRTAIRCDDPVLFLEHKHLYRQIYNKSQYPSSDFLIPFGKAKKVREGSDVSIITFGALVERSNQAAKRLDADGVSVEIIDLRTLVPYDWEAIAESVKKTSRVIVAHEDHLLRLRLRSPHASQTSWNTSMLLQTSSNRHLRRLRPAARGFHPAAVRGCGNGGERVDEILIFFDRRKSMSDH